MMAPDRRALILHAVLVFFILDLTGFMKFDHETGSY